MHMLMVVFRASLKERVYELLDRCHVKAFTEVNETVGYGQTGPAEGLAFLPRHEFGHLRCFDPDHARESSAPSSNGMRRRQSSRWEKPALRVFSWPAEQTCNASESSNPLHQSPPQSSRVHA